MMMMMMMMMNRLSILAGELRQRQSHETFI